MRPTLPLSLLLALTLVACDDPASDPICEDGQVLWQGGCLDDQDGDGVADDFDNCPADENPGQEDADSDGIGDVCDTVLPDDSDGDGVPDSEDNCPADENPGQEDADGDGIGDACDTVLPDDSDGDGVPDAQDNCPAVANPAQTDHDGDGEGDACEVQDGGPVTPFIIPVTADGASYQDSRDTSASPWDLIDVYPPNTADESGPEYYYVFTLPARMKVAAWIASPEPDGVDIDLQLLASLEPLALLSRNNLRVVGTLDPGTYFLTLDTYGGEAHSGPYALSFTAERYFAGTVDEPVLLGVTDLATPVTLPYVAVDVRDTSQSTSDVIDGYPPNALDESGPEFVYAFTVDEPVYFAGEILLPEPAGVDIDLHLLSSLSPITLIKRANHKILAELEPGTYYLVLDTYGGDAAAGVYTLNLTLRAQDLDPDSLLAPYMVQATEWIAANYGLLGYDIGSVLTHDITYGPYGVIPQTGVANKTMCVAAVMEIILTAMQLYADDTGDTTVWDFLPRASFQSLRAQDLKAHLWVNYDDIDSGGSADALRHFGMGMNVPFARLVPGSVVNVNRANGSGHAVVFLAFLDAAGNEYDVYPQDTEIVGFKYYSSQGSSTPGVGGMSYRWAVFNDYGCLDMPGQADCGILVDDVQYLLNTGVIYRPSHWRRAYYTDYTSLPSAKSGRGGDVSRFDPVRFDGVTSGD